MAVGRGVAVGRGRGLSEGPQNSKPGDRACNGRGQLRPAGASGLVGPQAAPCPVAGFMELVVVTFVFSFQQLLGYQRAQWSLVGYTNANFNFYRSK